jgi:hypothetical protein
MVRLGSVAEAQLVDSVEAEIVQTVYAEKEDQQIAFQTCVLDSATLHPPTWKGRSKRFCMMPRPQDDEQARRGSFFKSRAMMRIAWVSLK